LRSIKKGKTLVVVYNVYFVLPDVGITWPSVVDFATAIVVVAGLVLPFVGLV